jgi:3-deoxy-D-manno-octulosonic-acid transferase
MMVVLWSILVEMLWPVACLVARFSKSWDKQLRERVLTPDSLTEWRARRSASGSCVVFFCSSAGEYEQAKPFMDRLIATRPDVWPFVIFFSASGARFAKARGETAAWCLAPRDSIWAWRRLFHVIQPTACVVVRYELWPAFLSEARRYGRLLLVNATRSASSGAGGIGGLVRRALLRGFERVFAVGPEDARELVEGHRLDPARVIEVGDTKYDRVRERCQSRQTEVARLRERLSRVYGVRPRLIVGSAWPKDVEVALEAFASRRGHWQLILAPHDIGPVMVRRLSEMTRARGMSVSLLSSWIQGGEPAPISCDVVVADTMGMLSELYATADLAMVGGAMHFRVHNVLEPACHGLPLCWGPFYSTSPEARHFAGAGLARVVEDAHGLDAWWGEHEGRPPLTRDTALLAEVDRLCGATGRIMPHLLALLPKTSESGGVPR